jgi:hypothetical protein
MGRDQKLADVILWLSHSNQFPLGCELYHNFSLCCAVMVGDLRKSLYGFRKSAKNQDSDRALQNIYIYKCVCVCVN